MRKKVKNVKNTVVKVEFTAVLAEVLDGEKGTFEADLSKDEWLTKADAVLTEKYGKNWHTFPTFNPEGEGNGDKPLAQKQVNQIRLAVQASRKARLVAKYSADAKGNPLRGNPHAYWNELKGKHKELQAIPEKTKAGEKELRAKKALKVEDLRFVCENMLGHMTYCAVHPEAAQSPADTDKELNELVRRALNRMKELKVDLPPRARKAK